MEEKGPRLWELAHLNGDSIFIQHETNSPNGEPLTFVFGPFLFTSLSEAQVFEDTTGPYRLLKPMSGQQARIQPVKPDWVTGSTLRGVFGQGLAVASPDCIVIGDILIPLTLQGAKVADQTLISQEGTHLGPWEQQFHQFGPEGLRYMGAKLIRQMIDLETPH